MNGVSGKSGKTSSQDLLLKRLEKLGHEAGPAGLIRGADAAPGVAVKVFVATLQRVGPRKVEKAGGGLGCVFLGFARDPAFRLK
jgi:hypothetical protein